VERSAALARGLIVIAALLAPRASAQPAPESAAPARATDAAADRPAPPRWCAEELSELGDGMCYFEAAADAPPTTLILFLHTLVGANSSWQWEQQRLMARTAKAHGLAVLMPRGRRGIGPGRAPDVWAWPTSARAQAKVEDELVAEWQAARAAVETKRGRAFERVLVFGFSNGAYYATSLAMRARLEVDGYGIFAGGSGGKYHRLLAAKVERKTPIFVGYGSRDQARRDMQSLVEMLRDLNWPHRSKVQRVGHIVTDDQLRGAITFLNPKAAEG